MHTLRDAHTDTTQLIRITHSLTHSLTLALTHTHAHAHAHLEHPGHEMTPFGLRRHYSMLCLPQQRGRALQNAARVRLLHGSDTCFLWRHIYLRWSIPLRLARGSVMVVLAAVCCGILLPPIALFGSFLLRGRSGRLLFFCSLFFRCPIHC